MNIFFGPIHKKYIATAPIQYIFGYNTNNTLYNCANAIRNSTPTSYKFNIFLDPTQTNYTTVPTQFAILHQHPTLKSKLNIIFGPIHKKNIATAPMQFEIPHQHPTLKSKSI